jgi:hypothetical protein
MKWRENNEKNSRKIENQKKQMKNTKRENGERKKYKSKYWNS